METHSAPFDPDSIYTPNTAAAHLREKCPAGARLGPRHWRRRHAEGLPAINCNGRLLFLGSDLNRDLEESRVTPTAPEDRAAARVREQLQREARL